MRVVMRYGLVAVFLGLWVLRSSAQGAAPMQAPPPSAATGGAGAAPQRPLHPATEDQVREYLSLTGIITAVRAGMTANVDNMQMTAVPYYPADFWAEMKAAMLKIDLVAVYTPVLQRYLSEEDMGAMLAFYRSPAGKTFLAAQPVIARDAQVALRQKGGEIGEAVYAKHKEEIETAKKKYEAEHSGAAK